MLLKDRIKEAIDGAGISAADLARATKSTNAAVTFWLNGATKTLKGEKAAMIELATGYNAQWIVSGKGQKKVNTATAAMAAPSPALTAACSSSNKPLALIQQAHTAINVESLPVELQVICNAFSKLPDDNRTKVLADILQIITQAQGPPSNHGLPAYSHAATRAA